MSTDYVGWLRARGGLTASPFLAAEQLRALLEPSASADPVARVAGARTAGGNDSFQAHGVDRRRRVIRLLSKLPEHVRPVIHAVVVQYRSLAEVEPNVRKRRVMLPDLRHGQDLLARALDEGRG